MWKKLTCVLFVCAAVTSNSDAILAQNGDDQESASRPNIVFLFADDQSTYSVGCYGNEDVQTPHMDQLAADGSLSDAQRPSVLLEPLPIQGRFAIRASSR